MPAAAMTLSGVAGIWSVVGPVKPRSLREASIAARIAANTVYLMETNAASIVAQVSNQLKHHKDHPPVLPVNKTDAPQRDPNSFASIDVSKPVADRRHANVCSGRNHVRKHFWRLASCLCTHCALLKPHVREQIHVELLRNIKGAGWLVLPSSISLPKVTKEHKH